MNDLARPQDGPGCRPSDQTPSGSGGKAASIPRAAKRQSVDATIRSYLAAFRKANLSEITSKVSYESGWIVFRNSSGWRTNRYRMRELGEMTERLIARAAAQETEARRVETLGSTCEGSVGSADAPQPHLPSQSLKTESAA